MHRKNVTKTIRFSLGSRSSLIAKSNPIGGSRCSLINHGVKTFSTESTQIQTNSNTKKYIVAGVLISMPLIGSIVYQQHQEKVECQKLMTEMGIKPINFLRFHYRDAVLKQETWVKLMYAHLYKGTQTSLKRDQKMYDAHKDEILFYYYFSGLWQEGKGGTMDLIQLFFETDSVDLRSEILMSHPLFIATNSKYSSLVFSLREKGYLMTSIYYVLSKIFDTTQRIEKISLLDGHCLKALSFYFDPDEAKEICSEIISRYSGSNHDVEIVKNIFMGASEKWYEQLCCSDPDHYVHHTILKEIVKSTNFRQSFLNSLSPNEKVFFDNKIISAINFDSTKYLYLIKYAIDKNTVLNRIDSEKINGELSHNLKGYLESENISERDFDNFFACLGPVTIVVKNDETQHPMSNEEGITFMHYNREVREHEQGLKKLYQKLGCNEKECIAIRVKIPEETNISIKDGMFRAPQIILSVTKSLPKNWNDALQQIQKLPLSKKYVLSPSELRKYNILTKENASELELMLNDTYKLICIKDDLDNLRG